MTELRPKSIGDKFATLILHARALSEDSSSSGLLGPATSSPRRGHLRRRSLSSFQARRSIWTAGTITLLMVLGVCLWFSPTSPPANIRGPVQVADDDGDIPLGQSVDRGGREVFWWEQFPRSVFVR